MPTPRSLPARSLCLRRFGKDDHSATAMARFITSLNSPESSRSLVADVYGIADGGTKLTRRIASGAIPSSRAATSTIRSSKYAASGRPAPR